MRIGLAHVAAAATVAVALLIGLVPGALGIDPELGPAAALVVFTIGFWGSGALPLHLTSLLLFLFVVAFGIVPPDVVFAGFASSALWLVFGGLVIAAAIEGTRLGQRIAEIVVHHLHGSYRRVIYGAVAIGVGLAFLVPAAMGRVVILVPIFLALAERLGFARHSNGRTGILLAVGLATFVPPFAILPANLPNMVLLGGAETLYGVGFAYGEYLLLHFPLLGLGKAILIAELVLLMFPDRPRAPAPTGQEAGAPWSGGERRLFAILVVALLLWATDWLHGVSPGWVALGAGCACLLPRVGVLDTPSFETRINFGSFVFVAGLLGLVGLIDGSGLDDALGDAFLAWLPLEPGASAVNFAALAVLGTVTNLVTALAGVPAVLTPLARPIAEASGLPLESVLMTQVIAFSAVMFPYQSAPLMVGLQLAGIGLGPATRVSVALGLLTLLVLVPLDFLWWQWLGYLP